MHFAFAPCARPSAAFSTKIGHGVEGTPERPLSARMGKNGPRRAQERPKCRAICGFLPFSSDLAEGPARNCWEVSTRTIYCLRTPKLAASRRSHFGARPSRSTFRAPVRSLRASAEEPPPPDAQAAGGQEYRVCCIYSPERPNERRLGGLQGGYPRGPRDGVTALDLAVVAPHRPHGYPGPPWAAYCQFGRRYDRCHFY